MKFEVGKFYKHTSGVCIVITSEVEGANGEKQFLIEQGGDHMHVILGISTDEKNTNGFTEITKEEWTATFNSEEVIDSE